jgi:hypothetical protein
MIAKDRTTLFYAFIDACVAAGYFKNCTGCQEWNADKEMCKKFNVRPPVSIIVKGCEEYSEIPF